MTALVVGQKILISQQHRMPEYRGARYVVKRIVEDGTMVWASPDIQCKQRRRINKDGQYVYVTELSPPCWETLFSVNEIEVCNAS